MNIVFDYDGVITANFEHYRQLAFDLERSGHNVYILTGANPKRRYEIEDSLRNFPYTNIYFRKDDFISTPKNIGKWKKKMVNLLEASWWFDNDIKNYELAGVNFSDLNVGIVRI